MRICVYKLYIDAPLFLMNFIVKLGTPATLYFTRQGKVFK